VAVLCRQKLVWGKIDTGLMGCGSYPRLGSDQHGNDKVRLGGFDRAEQRAGIDRVNHGRTNGLQPPRLPDQLLVMMTAIATIRLSYASRFATNQYLCHTTPTFSKLMKLSCDGLLLLCPRTRFWAIRLLRPESNLEKRISAMSLSTPHVVYGRSWSKQTPRSWAQQPRLSQPVILRCWKIPKKSRL
jgi:hypothetical protein